MIFLILYFFYVIFVITIVLLVIYFSTKPIKNPDEKLSDEQIRLRLKKNNIKEDDAFREIKQGDVLRISVPNIYDKGYWVVVDTFGTFGDFGFRIKRHNKGKGLVYYEHELEHVKNNIFKIKDEPELYVYNLGKIEDIDEVESFIIREKVPYVYNYKNDERK